MAPRKPSHTSKRGYRHAKGNDMNPIFIIAGAPAVGKSTTAGALAAHFEKSIHISVDTLRDMVVSGLALPDNDWGPGLVEQLSLARACTVQMAIMYRQAGFAVVIDDFWDPNSQLREYSQLFYEASVYKVLLLPSQEAAEARNRKRSGGEDVYIAGGIRMVYDSLKTQLSQVKQGGWIIADTTGLTIDASVAYILSQVDR